MPKASKVSTIKSALASSQAHIGSNSCSNVCLSCEKTKEDCKKTIEQLESKHKQITDILSSQYKKDSLKLKEAVDEHKKYGEEIFNNQKTLNETIEKENASLKEKNRSLHDELKQLTEKMEEMRVTNLKNTLRSLPKFKRGKEATLRKE
jgi:hypothetical protein